MALHRYAVQRRHSATADESAESASGYADHSDSATGYADHSGNATGRADCSGDAGDAGHDGQGQLDEQKRYGKQRRRDGH
jgi:hypothetical protein